MTDCHVLHASYNDVHVLRFIGDIRYTVSPSIERYLEEKEGIQQSLPIPEVGAAKQTNGGTQTSEKPVIHRLETQAAIQFIGTCPDCGSSLEFAEGCMKCHACGYSECG